MKKIHVLGGGTTFPLAPHLAIHAPAFGTIAREIAEEFKRQGCRMEVQLHLTRLAGGRASLTTNDDLRRLADEITRDKSSKIVVMSCSVCDFEPVDGPSASRYSSQEPPTISFKASEKILPLFRKERKDIFLIGFSQTHGASDQEMFLKAERVMKDSSANLVVANDTLRRHNFIATPEESIYCPTSDRGEVVRELVSIALLRSNLTFTQSTVVDGQMVPWEDGRVPASLRTVVDYCVGRGAYKPIKDRTAGHFAVKIAENRFLTSVRKSNFNDLKRVGLVEIVTDGPDTVIAYGAKPSVGGQSQRIVFREHDGKDCIVHFHSPQKEGSDVPVASQREYECGSHECGANTSRNLREYPEYGLSAVMLDNHGPNIVFNRATDPNKIIEFIEANFDLELKTGPAWEE